MKNNLLSIRNLKVYYYLPEGILKAVDDVSLDISKNEVVGIVGESGCGKSTLALSIMRLIPPPGRIEDGKIFFEDKDLLELTEDEIREVRGKDITMTFQDPMTFLNPVLNVGFQIGEPVEVHEKRKRAVIKRRVIEILKIVQMPSPSKVAELHPHELSGGMRQRSLISLALICKPILVIADEPTTALDVTIQAQVLDFFKKLRDTHGISLFIISHDLGIIAELCDRVYVMYAGKIVEHGDIVTIYDEPKHPYTIGLYKSVLSIDEMKKTLTTIDGTVPDLINLPKGCRFHPRCKDVMPICYEKDPSIVTLNPKHAVSCWLYS